MEESNQVLAYEDPSKTFLGVRFVLLGFDSVHNKEKIESKLLDAGGVDAVNYGSECTHVIVDKLVYDDPVCVAARRDGKTLVSGLWVDHSFDVGMPVDPTSVMYRPMRDLNGIPGAKSLIICLTGYQRQDRDDIMTMVSLMGANFSKPLVANKVTHLICYKFEGEKYELAKKMKKIKLINHRWLEDCLKAWEILPESDYAKSGYELEMETEAKDSEEETEDMAAVVDVRRKYVMSPQITPAENKRSQQSPLAGNSTYASASKTSAAIGETSNFELRSRKEADLEKASFSGDKTYGHVEMPSASSALTHGKISSELPSSMFAFMMDSGKNTDILVSASESAKKSPAADVCKLHSEIVLRSPPTKSSLSLSSGRTERNSGSTSSKNIDEVLASGGSKMSLGTHQDGTDGFKTPPRRTDLQLEEGKTTSSPGRRKSPLSRNSSKSTIVRNDLKILETYPDGTDGVKTPVKRTDLQVEEEKTTPSPDRRKTTLSRVTSKSTRLRNDLKTSVESESAIKLKEALTSEISTDGSHVLSRHTSNITHCNDLGEEASLSPKEALKVPVTLNERRESNDDALKCYSRGLEKQTSSTNLDVKDLCLNLTDNSAGEAKMHQREMKSIEPPVPGADMPMVEKSNELVDLNFSEVEHTVPKSSALKRKMPAKKTLGARRSIAKGATTKLKGSLQKSVLQNEDFYHSNVVVATGGTDSASISEKVDTVFPSNSSKSPMANIQDREATADDSPVGDKTIAQAEKVESEFDTANKKEKFAEVEVPQPRDMCQEKTVGVSGTGKQADGKIVLSSNSKVAKSLEDKKDGETSEAVGSQKVELAESKPTADNIEKKLTNGKKRPLAKSKTKKVKDSMEEGKTVGSSDKQEKKKTVAGDEKTVALAGKSKKRPSKKLKSSPDAEKENDPVTTDHQSTSNVTGAAGKEVSQLSKKSPRKGLKAGMCGDGSVNKGQDEKVTAEPTWFILSGHRLQRKEFQQLIKRLKGRVCRDSHNWSYQATHLIVPDPIRRTEKFFAAVASGSWVLTTDYLSASNEAGKLLSEEPYEWNKKCLSEDGAINLEAPRKWRLLRERTGHGAFYGMRIIIYGECIAPPLDTLKRVIKAGEGTILATAPPYNRFFQSRVDFAIVSPGMPRVDMWVQEFLRHEIPCILSDYLVEYVCKPGYSLERHVQYNTHAWAEKSLKNLVRRVEEVADEVRTPEAEDDLACQVCESRDRGDEMLICGDESGDLGCGVGIHVDCLDPPLTDIPEDDWFCPLCSAKRGRKNVRQSSSKQSKSKK